MDDFYLPTHCETLTEIEKESFIKAIKLVNDNFLNVGTATVKTKRLDKPFGPGKYYEITFYCGGDSYNEALIKALLKNKQSQFHYVMWQSKGLHQFHIEPSHFRFYTQSELARKHGVLRQRINEIKSTFEELDFFGKKYYKEF